MSLIPLIWWKFFDFFTLKIKKNYWMVTEMCLPFSSIQWDWMSTERSLSSAWNPDFSEHSVSIQWTFRNVSVDWKENFHPVEKPCYIHFEFLSIHWFYTLVIFLFSACLQTKLTYNLTLLKMWWSLNYIYIQIELDRFAWSMFSTSNVESDWFSFLF